MLYIMKLDTPLVVVTGIGIAVLAAVTYALTGSKSGSSSLRSASEFPITNQPTNSYSSQSYINPVSPSQTPPRDTPYPKNLATSLVTNVGGKRSKRRHSRKRRVHTKRRK
jgi:hypothetical protein